MMRRMSKPFIVLFLLLGCLLLISPNMARAQAVVLEVPERIQEYDQWCWAGVTASVLSYYGTDLDQCVIAEYARTRATWHDFGSTDCCVNALLGCNYWNYNYSYDGSMQDILTHWGVSNIGYSSTMSLAFATSEIIAGRPFIPRWGWDSGGGHFIVGHGFDDSLMYYMNPWFNEGHKIAEYDWVVDGANHTWTHTNQMTTNPPCPCNEITACCEGCDFVNGGGCDDGDPCTTGDICQNGCVGVPYVCDQPDICHTIEGVSCDGLGGCNYPVLAEGSGCDDDDPCTHSDKCSLEGLCSGTAYACDSPGQCRKTEDAECLGDGNCTYLADTGATCDDGNPCTFGDLCSDSAQCAGEAYSCNSPGTCETIIASSCQGDGSCDYPVNEGVICDDGDPCTQSDRCGLDKVCAGAGYSCSEPGTCQKSDGATCDGSGGCNYLPQEEGAGCDDGDPCTFGDACTADLTCIGSATDCDDQNPCTADNCDMGDGSCHSDDLEPWSECGIPGEEQYCFDGICEATAENDTCPTAISLSLGETYNHQGAFDAHPSRTIPEACASEILNGPDCWFDIELEAEGSYLLSLQSDSNHDLALALWSSCEAEADGCLEAVDASKGGDSIETLGFDPEESGKFYIQVLASDIMLEKDSSSQSGTFSLLVQKVFASDGDEVDGDDDGDEELDRDPAPDGDEADADETDGNTVQGDDDCRSSGSPSTLALMLFFMFFAFRRFSSIYQRSISIVLF